MENTCPIGYEEYVDNLKLALEDGVITDYTLNIDEKFGICDVVFISTPVSYISDYAYKLQSVIKPNCIITDTGSTKKQF